MHFSQKAVKSRSTTTGAHNREYDLSVANEIARGRNSNV